MTARMGAVDSAQRNVEGRFALKLSENIITMNRGYATNAVKSLSPES